MNKETLRKFEEALYYFVGVVGEVKINSKKQEEKIYRLVRDLVSNKRVFIGGTGRSGEIGKILRNYLTMRLGYDGRTRRQAYFVDEDPSPRAKKGDISILISGSAKTPRTIQLAQINKKNGVDTYLITASDPKRNSIYDYIDKENAIVIVRLTDEEKQRRQSLAPLGTKFEFAANVFIHALYSTIKDYIERYYKCDKNSYDTIPMKTFFDSVKNTEKYLKYEFKEKMSKQKKVIEEFISNLGRYPSVKLVGAGVSQIIASMFSHRLVHTGKEGIESGVMLITSEKYGPEGSSNISSEDMVIALTRSGESKFPLEIMDEAYKKGSSEIWLITSNEQKFRQLKRKYKTSLKGVIIPSVGFRGDVDYLGYQVFLDSVIASLAFYLEIQEEEMKIRHSIYG